MAENDSGFTIRAADYLAGTVCQLIDRGVLDARSGPGDALMDYSQERWASHQPEIQKVRDRFRELQATRHG